MQISTYYKKINPTTANGYSIQVITTYQSFDKSEIDKVEDILKDSVGALTVIGSQRIVQEVGIPLAQEE